MNLDGHIAVHIAVWAGLVAEFKMVVVERVDGLYQLLRINGDLPYEFLEWVESCGFDNTVYVSSYAPDEVGNSRKWTEVLIDIKNWWYVCGDLIFPYKPGQENYEGAILRFGMAGIDMWVIPGRRAWACL